MTLSVAKDMSNLLVNTARLNKDTSQGVCSFTLPLANLMSTGLRCIEWLHVNRQHVGRKHCNMSRGAKKYIKRPTNPLGFMDL